MTVNEKIIQALEALKIPVTSDFFGGKQEEYITFNYADDRAVFSADDGPEEDVAYMQIHYFLPAGKDYLENKRKIRKALLKAGFTYPDATVLMEPDNRTRHIIFECEIENDYEMED